MPVERQIYERQQERKDTILRRDLVVGIGREYFAGTALVEDKPWTVRDLVQVDKFLIATAPFAHPKVAPSYWEHLILASLYGRFIAERAPGIGLDPNEAEALLLLHDAGRLAIAHRYLRNDVVEHSIFLRVGVRPELLEKLPSVPGMIGVKVPFISSVTYTGFEDVPNVQRATDVMDNVGKRGRNGELFDIKEYQEYSMGQPARYTGGMWPSERRGRRAIAEGGKQKFALELTLAEIDWLKETHGIEFSSLREAVAQEFGKLEHQAFLLALKDAQETLDPEVDIALGRPGVTTVVFDVGDVLFQGKDGEVLDNELARRLSGFFDCPQEVITSAFDTLHQEGMTGQIGEIDYLRRFWTMAGKEPPETIEELRRPFIHPDIYQPDREIQEILAALSKNPNIKLQVFSNVIASLSAVVEQRLGQLYPQIPPENILFSNRLGVAKGVSSNAFERLAHEVKEDPQAIVFIDNNEGYTSTARGTTGMRGFTFRGNPFKGLTAQQRLKTELQKAGLI